MNGLAFAHFWSNSDNSFFDWCKTINIFLEKYFFRKYDKKIWDFFTKNLMDWTVKHEIFHEDKTNQS